MEPTAKAGSRTRHLLSFDEPVNEFEYRLNGLPLGNGRIGCMFTGGPARDLMLLNHEELRPRIYRESEHPASDRLTELRTRCLCGEWEQGSEVFEAMVGETGALRQLNNYHPAADLILEMDLPGHAEGYRRILDFEKGYGEIGFTSADIAYTRRYFVSTEQQLIVLHIEAAEGGLIDLRVSLGRMPFPGCAVRAEGAANELFLSAGYPDGMTLSVGVEVVGGGGLVAASPGVYSGEGEARENYGIPLVTTGVTGAEEVAVFVALDIDCGANPPARLPPRGHSVAEAREMFATHAVEHSRLFNRASIDLGGSAGGATNPGSTSELIHQAYLGRPDPGLIETMFDMGRYLLLSSSRNCSLPANLQGIWNHSYAPPWQCRYQLDVNLQANYWAANPTNLAQCNEPLFGLLGALLPGARRFARDLYGCRGIVLGVGTDGENLRYPSNLETQCVAGWLARHFWDHYLFTLDRDFLASRAYPFMREVGEFFEDFLFEDGEGQLTILPSNSPENNPANRRVRLSKNSTIDLAVAKELFSTLIEAAKVLAIDEEMIPVWAGILERLPDWPVSDGLLKEWADEDAEENQRHRHLSHLYPLFPGSAFAAEGMEKCVDASLAALGAREKANRGDACSFSYVWAALLLARAGRENEALERLSLFCRGFLMENMLSSMGDWRQLGLGRSRSSGLASHIFQIEAGLAATAAIAEMLLQSGRETVTLLPALPDAWPRGEVRGLCARGGYTVGMAWRAARLQGVSIRPIRAGLSRVRLGVPMEGEAVVTCGEVAVEHSAVDGRDLLFEVEAGKDYLISAR